MRRSVTIILAFFPFFYGFSQCCSPGNPVGGDANQGVLNRNTLKVIGIVKNSVSNDYYEGDKKYSGTSFVDKGTFRFSGLTLAYGLSKNITIENELGYFLSKKQEYVTPRGNMELKGAGLSDLSLLGKYRIFSRSDNQFELTCGAGGKIPIGQYQQRNENGILLPIDIQPSSGAYGYLGTFFLYKGFVEKNIRFFLTSRVQITPYAVALTEISKYYRFGNFYTSSLFSSWSISHRWNAVLQLRHEFRSRDVYKIFGESGYRVYESSGGQKLIAVPQFIFEICQGLNASFMVDIPIYQYYNQRQLATAYAGTVTLTKNFNLNRQAETPR